MCELSWASCGSCCTCYLVPWAVMYQGSWVQDLRHAGVLSRLPRLYVKKMLRGQ